MKRKIFTGEGHYHFVTFSRFEGRRLIEGSEAKDIVIKVLARLTENEAVRLVGFVVMPDHVHAILGYNDDGYHPIFMQEWKRWSSYYLRKYLEEKKYPYLDQLKVNKGGKIAHRIWTGKYYDFNLYNPEKVLEKLNYMHENPLRTRLVESLEGYPWSSYRFYYLGDSVGPKISPLF